jgi:DNA-binding beta-propeller fold protein YncE
VVVAHGAPAGAPRGRTHAFIHLLNLKGGWAHCIDLPLPFGMGRATAGSIDISPDGKELYVADWTNGAVAIVNPAAVKVLRVAQLPPGEADDRTFAAASDSGLLHVAGNDVIVTIDTVSLRVVDRWRMDGEVLDLEASPDGRTLYAAVDDSIMMLDAATGSPLGTLPVGPVDDILRAES